MSRGLLFAVAAHLLLTLSVHAITEKELADHVRDLKTPDGFTVVVESPWVVIGDEPADRVKARAVATVRWATTRLKRDFFSHDPQHIIDIWLFKDADSYRRHARELFGDEPSSPYGYYSEEHRALVMNIATGGGTLVHEMVHPFIRTDFPDCPAWFNEGLGSLFEQSADRDGHIVGLTNWRLKGLQEAIRKNTLPSFKTLTSSTSSQFYHSDAGTHYAQARYLCYYLQEKGLLVKFYRDFHDNVGKDPTGFDTLKRTLKDEDMDAFQKRWQDFVLSLTFP